MSPVKPEITPLPWMVKTLQKIEFPHKLGILDRFYGKRLAHHNVCWVETAAGVPWKLDLTNSTHRWIIYGQYEGPGFLVWARRFLPENGIIVDSGANIGQMLVYLSGFVATGKVFAFEPHQEAFSWLQECLLQNPSLRVECINTGLGENTANMFLQSPGPNNLHGAWSQVSATDGMPISIIRLQDFLKARTIDQVHLWKLDMEGHELQALHGAEACLARQSILAIYAELGFGKGEEIRKYLQSFGYGCYLINRHGQLHPAGDLPAHINALFLPEKTCLKQNQEVSAQ